MGKDQSKASDLINTINRKWDILKRELEQATENYLELRSMLEEMDLFMREVVNRTILLVQEMHEAISRLEQKAEELESGISGGTSRPSKAPLPSPPVQQQRPLPPPPQPVQQSRPPLPSPQQSQPLSPPPAQQPVQQQRPLPPPMPPMNPRQELLEQLKSIFKQRQNK